MKRKPLIAAALAVALVLGASIAPAAAYFTDTTQATGTVEIKFGTITEMKEWYAERVKHVTISNDADSDSDVWVRAAVFAPTLSGLECQVAGDGWIASDMRVSDSDAEAGYWYVYTSKVAPGTDAKELTATLTFPKVKSETQPDGSVYGDNVSVVVVYEYVVADDQPDATTYDKVVWTAAKKTEGGN